MKRALPEAVKVGWRAYRVDAVGHAWSTISGRYGETSHLEHVIRVNAEHEPRPVAQTLLHEVMHACYWTFGIADEDDEERTIKALASALTTVWVDNPELLAWIEDAMA